MAHGFLYLVAILDVASRKVLAFRLSNTLTADFRVAALQDAPEYFGVPEIFNTGSQFTSEEWLQVLKPTGCRISMDGKGRWICRDGREAQRGLQAEPRIGLPVVCERVEDWASALTSIYLF
jgi:transposase InsO family protein